ncbi:MAG: hypothetical protein J6T26_10110, partial [Firmicutes bacterium]|nr:hypothetical protein [Bacillota bacterium]
MKSTVTRLYLLFTLVIALLLFPSSPARADAAVELTSVRLMIDGREQSLGFRPDRLEYEISYVSSVPVEITVEAEAMAGCNLRIDNVPYAGGSGSATWSTADSCIINLQVYYKTHQQLYLIHVNILPPDPPAPSGGQETGGEPENNEEGPAGGGQSSGNSGQNSGNSGQNSGNGGQGSGNGGQGSGHGGQTSGNGGQHSV